MKEWILKLSLTTVLKWGSLIALSLGSAALWYYEVMFHGWDGLTWISYFHWAVPISVCAFLIWASIVGRFTSLKHRLFFFVGSSALACCMYLVTEYVLIFMFASGPQGLLVIGTVLTPLSWLPLWLGKLLAPFVLAMFGFSLLAWLIFLPMLIAKCLTWFRIHPSWRARFWSTGLFISAYPVALFVMPLLNMPGQADALHAIKTGCIVPMLIIGLGALFLLPEAEVAVDLSTEH